MTSPTMSIEEVGEVLGCKRRRVFELLADGTLERAPRFGRSLRIYRESVMRALSPAVKGRKRRVSSGALDFTLDDLPGYR